VKAKKKEKKEFTFLFSAENHNFFLAKHVQNYYFLMLPAAH
jgi:hypothetical protein